MLHQFLHFAVEALRCCILGISLTYLHSNHSHGPLLLLLRTTRSSTNTLAAPPPGLHRSAAASFTPPSRESGRPPSSSRTPSRSPPLPPPPPDAISSPTGRHLLHPPAAFFPLRAPSPSSASRSGLFLPQAATSSSPAGRLLLPRGPPSPPSPGGSWSLRQQIRPPATLVCPHQALLR
jgi:hypothetical protein